ncbi:MAG: hypothetical protein IJY62_02450 [Clostridia bacterium]|nr:hypothetical protein [Clostridia bacterium]
MDLFIDIGSTNFKWAFSDFPEKTYATPFPAPLRAEYPYFEVSASAISSLVKDVIDKSQPQRVFFSVQMHGYVLLKNGCPVTEYVSWRDERGASFSPAFTLTKEHGVDLKPNLPRLSLEAQTVEFDEFCTLGSYLVKSLTGINATHITDAAPSGFYNVKTRTAEEVPFRLPEALYSVDAVGMYGSSEIYSPIGDQQAAVLGATQAVGGFDGYILNLGTAGQLCLVEKGFVSGEFESRPYFSGRTLCTITRLPGGGVISKHTDGEIAERLVEEYGAARKKLPVRDKVLATGGLVKYRRELIETVLGRLGLRYEMNSESDALAGLSILAKGEIK